jgi:hypothetical protein
MARRAGKAASRKARQRNTPRPPRPAAAPIRDEPTVDATPIPPVGTPDAREAISLTPPRRVTAPTAGSGASALSDRERTEFHYVERDLRSLGILTAIMAVMLILAWVAFQAIGVTT